MAIDAKSMPDTLKQLIVVLLIATLAFRSAKPIALQFSTEGDFARRRNVWFALTVTAFLSPNFWLFALIAAPLFAWAGRKDSNPVAFYLFVLHVVPPVSVDIPVIAISKLFSLDNYRLLAFCVLVPTMLRLRRSKDSTRIRGLTSMDALLLGYGAVQVALFIPPDLPNHLILPDSFTNVVRRGFLFFLDVYVLYYVVSRSCATRNAIAEAQASFCLSCALMALLAVFESQRHWLLYADIETRWQEFGAASSFYLMRGDVLRAKVSSGHALALGYMLAVAFGFWLYLRTHIKARNWKIALALILWLGLLATYSRGPWLGAIIIYFAFTALGPHAISKLSKAGMAAALLIGVIIVTPLGQRVISVLPFMGGSVDSGTVIYREQLATRSWELISASPFFGDQLAYTKLEDLRQGEGIIDLVNTYAEIALHYGLVGLTLLLLLILVGFFKSYRMVRQIMPSDPDLAMMGVSLMACIVGALSMSAASSFGTGAEKTYYLLAALSAGYICLATKGKPRSVAGNRGDVSRTQL